MCRGNSHLLTSGGIMIRSTMLRCGALAALLLTPLAGLAQAPVADPKSTSGEGACNNDKEPALEVRFTDNSVMKLNIRDEFVDFVTEYGKLKIPMKDIEKIEFGLRVPEPMKARIEAAIADLGAPDFK